MSDAKPVQNPFAFIGDPKPIFEQHGDGGIGPTLGVERPKPEPAAEEVFDQPNDPAQVQAASTNVPIGSAMAARARSHFNLTQEPSGVLGQNRSPGPRR